MYSLSIEPSYILAAQRAWYPTQTLATSSPRSLTVYTLPPHLQQLAFRHPQHGRPSPSYCVLRWRRGRYPERRRLQVSAGGIDTVGRCPVVASRRDLVTKRRRRCCLPPWTEAHTRAVQRKKRFLDCPFPASRAGPDSSCPFPPKSTSRRRSSTHVPHIFEYRASLVPHVDAAWCHTLAPQDLCPPGSLCKLRPTNHTHTHTHTHTHRSPTPPASPFSVLHTTAKTPRIRGTCWRCFCLSSPTSTATRCPGATSSSRR